MQVQNLPITRSTTIEIVIPNLTATNQYAFPDMPYLRDKKILAITFSNSQYSIQSGRANVGWEYMLNGGTWQAYPMFITLTDRNNVQFIQNMPHLELISTQSISATGPSQGNYSTNGIVAISPKIVVWPKSYVYFPNAPSFTGYSLQFQIFYQA